MRALALYIAQEAQRRTPPELEHPGQSADVEKLARRIVAGCVTVLMVLAAAVALPLPTGG
jgi:hypothetical protein